MRPRSRPVAVVALAAALLLAGCGLFSPDPAEVMANAPEKTLEAGSVRLAAKLGFPPDAASFVAMRATVDGVVDYRDRKADLTLKYLPDQGTPLPLEVRSDGRTSWYRIPDGTGVPDVPEGVWLEAGPGEGDTSSLEQGAADLGHVFVLLEAITGDISKVGTEDVRGTRTTRYTVAVDLPRASERVGTYMKQLIGQRASDIMPMDVWIDGDGRIRRVRYAMRVKRGLFQEGDVVLDVELYDFGVPVDITPPPAREVKKLDDYVKDDGLGG